MWAFPQQIVGLSFRLHKELADEYNGAAEWGYRGLKTLCIEGNISSSHLRNIKNGIKKANPDINLPEELDWISPEIIDGWTHLGDAESTAQVHPYKFTLYILKKVLETGAVDLVIGKVVEVTADKNGKANGVTYTTTQDKSRFNQTFQQQDQTNVQKETLTQPSTKSESNASSNKQQTKSSLHHPDNPTFKSDASLLPVTPKPLVAQTSSDSNPSSNNFRSIHNTSYTASNNLNRLSPKSSEESLNLSTDEESILDGNVSSSEDSVSGHEAEDYELAEGFQKNTDSNDIPISSSYDPASLKNKPQDDENTSKDYTKKNFDSITDDNNTSEIKSTDKKSTDKITHHLSGDQVVLALGPWTSKILPSCPISGLRAHSITIQPSKQVSPFALFTEMRTSRVSYVSPEIYPRRDEVYVCGEGDTSAEVPETSDDVEVLRSRCDELFKHVGAVSPNLKNGRILKRQACYLPVVDVPSHSGPFIGCTNVDNLYLASGHSCWGINNAPATGLLMSEILLDGEARSASVDGLEPEFYFDASLQ